MGRSAGKVESMETQIAQLMIAAQKLRRGSYYTKAPQHSGFGAGAVKAPSLTTAKDVEASRLKFSGKPRLIPQVCCQTLLQLGMHGPLTWPCLWKISMESSLMCKSREVELKF